MNLNSKPLMLLSFVVLMANSTMALGYSVEYCISLYKANEEALDTRNWNNLLSIATDRVKNCKPYITTEDYADALNDQAIAYIELGNLGKAILLSTKCLELADLPQCHISKARASPIRKHFIAEMRKASELAQERIGKIRYELASSTDQNRRAFLESKLILNESIKGYASSFLN